MLINTYEKRFDSFRQNYSCDSEGFPVFLIADETFDDFVYESDGRYHSIPHGSIFRITILGDEDTLNGTKCDILMADGTYKENCPLSSNRPWLKQGFTDKKLFSDKTVVSFFETNKALFQKAEKLQQSINKTNHVVKHMIAYELVIIFAGFVLACIENNYVYDTIISKAIILTASFHLILTGIINIHKRTELQAYTKTAFQQFQTFYATSGNPNIKTLEILNEDVDRETNELLHRMNTNGHLYVTATEDVSVSNQFALSKGSVVKINNYSKWLDTVTFLYNSKQFTMPASDFLNAFVYLSAFEQDIADYQLIEATVAENPQIFKGADTFAKQEIEQKMVTYLQQNTM